MPKLHARTALLPDGWHEDVSVTFDGTQISSVTPGAAVDGSQVDILLPAPANLHSHAFQRAMAGLTESRGPDGQDSFWTWRSLMYRFLEVLGPDDVEAIAAQVQMEMAEAGYAAVGEFHYLHHQPDGTPYSDAEMSARIAAAAEETGLGLTLLPVFYMQGGCDGRDLGPGQVRFGTDLDGFARLLDDSRAALGPLPEDTALGVAPHSLRAVSVDALTAVPDLAAKGPIHIHIAEQRAEVNEVLAHMGATPVRWLLEIMDVGPQWCLIHATHMDKNETQGLARTGAVAGLCPVTESNLGDGIFDGHRFLEHGGCLGIGSDSNIRIGLTEELRTLEYSQRLRDQGRAVLASEQASVGRTLYDAACRGGAQAVGRNSGRIAVGQCADLVALDGTDVDLDGQQGDRLLDAWIFAAGDRVVRDVWSAGRHIVTEGRHMSRDSIESAYKSRIRHLRDAL